MDRHRLSCNERTVIFLAVDGTEEPTTFSVMNSIKLTEPSVASGHTYKN
jgi:hypothetical protein